MLERLHDYDSYVPQAEILKNSILYEIYQRPMFEWSLSCNSDSGESINDAVEMLETLE